MVIEPTKLAWLAGLIDGEGCIYARQILRTNSPSQNSLEVRLEIHSVSARMIEAVAAICDSLGVHYLQAAPRMQPLSKRPAIRIRVTRKTSMQVLLAALLPYLVVKRAEAARVLEYLSAACGAAKYRLTEADRSLPRDLKTLKLTA